MKFVIQTVSQASIHCKQVDTHQSIGHGLVIYVGIHQQDTWRSDTQLSQIVDDILSLRCMEDDQGKINVSVQDQHWSILLVSNFTLYGQNIKGKRLDFSSSARFDQAKQIYDRLYDCFLKSDVQCITGNFGDYMTITSTVTGPINLVLDYDFSS